jgi:methylthioribose-1-phosphate isomerase
MAFPTRGTISTVGIIAMSCAALSACDVQNNQLIGRVEADIDRHQVVVTHCYTKQLAKVLSTDDGDSWTPCKNAAVVIKDGMLFVNGESYGKLGDGDSVLVEDGKAKIIPP